MDLDCLVADPFRNIGGKQLGHRSFFGEFAPLLFEPGSPVDHKAGSLDFRGHIGNHPLDSLKLGDGLPELNAFFRVCNGPLKRPLCQTHRHSCDGDAPCIQRDQELFEAFILLAQQILGRDAAVFKKEFRGN